MALTRGHRQRAAAQVTAARQCAAASAG
jgi:hypothetical protein